MVDVHVDLSRQMSADFLLPSIQLPAAVTASMLLLSISCLLGVRGRELLLSGPLQVTFLLNVKASPQVFLQPLAAL